MFKVIDRRTAEEADIAMLAEKEAWVTFRAENIEAFAITELGDLILCDKFGSFIICPLRRFEIKME